MGARLKAWWDGKDPQSLIETPAADQDGEDEDAARMNAESEDTEGEDAEGAALGLHSPVINC